MSRTIHRSRFCIASANTYPFANTNVVSTRCLADWWSISGALSKPFTLNTIMQNTMNVRINKYLGTIELVPDGQRNATLYNTGLLLRTRFGLTDDALEEALYEVNQTKCIPPLEESDVRRIAGSVDKANAPIGNSSGNTFERNKKKSRKTRTVHVVTTSSSPVSVADLLKKDVSIYRNPHKIPTGTVTVCEALEMFFTGGEHQELIKTIRNEPNKDKRNELKRKLPAIVPHANPQRERNIIACEEAGRSGIITPDFDNIPVEKLAEAKEKIAAVPYVFAVCASASATGVVAFAAYEGTPDLKTLLTAMQHDFPYEIDMSGTDISRLRYMTFDADLIVKPGEVCPAVLIEQMDTAVRVSENTKNAGENCISTYTDAADLIPYVPFPIDCLPAPMRNIVGAVQRVIGLKDSSTPAVCCLAVVSAVIGASCKIRIKRGYEQPAHIFTGIIAKSSQAKSPVLEYLLGVLQEMQSVWIDEWQNANEAYKEKLLEWKAAKKSERGMCPSELPPPKRLIVSDATIEAIGLRLKENPLGLLLYADELDVLLGNMGRYGKGKDLPYYITIHNGSTLTIDRKTNGGLFHVPRPSLATCGGIQPQILRQRLIENPDYFHSGFLARFLIAMPPIEAIKLNSRELTDAEAGSYERFITDILSARENMLVEGKVKPQVFPISAGAWNVLLDYQHRHADLSIYETDRHAAIVGKFLTNAARIALILHVAQLTENGIHWKQNSPVSEETMRNACIITQWFVAEAKRILAVLAGESADGELSADQRTVLRALRNSNMPMTENEIRFTNRQTRRIDVAQTLKELLKAGSIQDEFRPNDGKGRPAIQYKISDSCAVSVSRNAKNTGENSNSTYTDAIVAEKNADSDPEVIECFEEYKNPESSSESVEQCPDAGTGNDVNKRHNISGHPLCTEADYAEVADILAGF